MPFHSGSADAGMKKKNVADEDSSLKNECCRIGSEQYSRENQAACRRPGS